MPPVKLKLGIIGYPLEHSVSPIMHTAALQHLNINGEYKAYEIKENELEDKLTEFKKIRIRGLNVTIPFKKKIIPFVNRLTDKAKLANAVNTLVFEDDGKITGDNTDINGFWEAIPEEFKKKLIQKPGETSRRNVSVIGCGGAASAVVIACMINNIKAIKIYGRNKNKLEDFQNYMISLVEISRRDISTEIDLLNNIDLTNTQLLVNTTPIGMYPDTNESPILIQMLEKLPKDSLIYDLIYNPLETKLLKGATSLHLKTLNGIGMLVNQGAASLNLWLGKNCAPIEVMEQAVQDFLGAKSLK